jgi:hypothetical protein
VPGTTAVRYHFAPIRYNTAMSQTASAIVRSPAEMVQSSPVSQAPNGICCARSGEIAIGGWPGLSVTGILVESSSPEPVQEMIVDQSTSSLRRKVVRG